MRVRVRLKGPKASVVTSAFVNSGFESNEPEIIVPERLAPIRVRQPEQMAELAKRLRERIKSVLRDSPQ